MNPLDFRAPFFRKSWVRVLNGSGETVPPFAVLRVTGSTTANNEVVYNIAKPSATNTDQYLINGPSAIGSSSSAEGYATFLDAGGYVLHDSSATPAVGDTWGPKSGQWSVTKNAGGFRVLGTTTSAAGKNAILAIRQEKAVHYHMTSNNGAGSSSTSLTALTNSVDSDLTSGGEFASASGVITTNVAGMYMCAMYASISSAYTRNQQDIWSVKLQYSTNGGGAWSDLFAVPFNIYHPDVALGAGGSPSYTAGTSRLFSLQIDTTYTFRAAHTATTTGSLPTTSIGADIFLWRS